MIATDRRSRLHGALDRLLDCLYRRSASDAGFEESKHPRGKPQNAGMFASGAGGGGKSKPGQKKPAAAAPGKGKGKRGEPLPQKPEAPPPMAPKLLSSLLKEAIANRAEKAPLKLTPTKQRAWTGGAQPTKNTVSKLETGRIGEQAVIAYLQSKGMKDAKPLNTRRNNFPVDIVQNHGAIEVKAGLSGNSGTAQQWRATIGGTSKQEAAWLKIAGKAEKKEWNHEKQAAIMERKKAVVAELNRQWHTPVKSATMTTIINPDTQTVDIYRFEGFHARIPWNDKAVPRAYVGSFKTSFPTMPAKQKPTKAADQEPLPINRAKVPKAVRAEFEKELDEYMEDWKAGLVEHMKQEDKASGKKPKPSGR